MNYIEEIETYIPNNEQEQEDLITIKDFVSTYKGGSLFRTNKIAHFSASAWVVNQSKTRVLMCFHNIYKNWGWLGGHADGDEDLLAVAVKEAKEESGLENIIPLNEKAISVEILPVPYHIKNGKFIGSHLHLNFTYLLQAHEEDELKIKADENSALSWVDLDEAPKRTNEKCMVPIYEKLNLVVKQI